MTIKPAHFPNHKVYSVCKLRDGKSSWTEIGVAFPHRDGNGFTLKMSALPTPGGEFVLRRDRSPQS
jgi:hypothetical protein